jgi:AcrR family transcriptional regulator
MKRTFTEQARRTQIVEAAIETIAELGYAGASFAQIAKRAKLSSTGLISYHFASKEELMGQVAAAVFADISAYMTAYMVGHTGATDALHAYIRGTITFIGEHRKPMKALLEIFMHGGFPYDETTEQTVLSPIEQILRRGQESGEFRSFDTRVMASVIQRAGDGLPLLLAAHPDIDPDLYARELVTIFDLSTRRER